MAETLIARTPLGGESAAPMHTYGDATIAVLREMPAAAMIDLRLDPADAGAMEDVRSALSFELPLVPGKTAVAGERVAVWCGPDQWLIVAPPAHAAPLMLALGGCAGSAIDVADQRAEFELAGPRAIDVLRKGCAIDLHPRVFRPGDCALTALARVRVALRQADERPAYRIFVERSVAVYLWDWLLDAMREYCGA
jgi:sarcosine oxidase subunit gamma